MRRGQLSGRLVTLRHPANNVTELVREPLGRTHAVVESNDPLQIVALNGFRETNVSGQRRGILFMPSTSKPTGWRVQRCSGGGDTVAIKVRILPQNRRGYLMRLLEIEINSVPVDWVLGYCRRQSDVLCVDETGYCLRIERTVRRALRWSGAGTGRKPLWIQGFCRLTRWQEKLQDHKV